MRSRTPLGGLARGLVAGAVGSAVQSLFFRLTGRIAPAPPRDVFRPPERQQRDEQATETVARRFVEGLMHRGPLTDEQKAIGGSLVHYAFGAGWGALYVLARETFPRMGWRSTALGFSTAVWLFGDNLLLPAFELAAWPQRYPARNHAYAWAAHVVYALGVLGTYEALGPRSRFKTAASILRSTLASAR
jgi:uncharacterized membrane protein YagU involved in acid resistance